MPFFVVVGSTSLPPEKTRRQDRSCGTPARHLDREPAQKIHRLEKENRYLRSLLATRALRWRRDKRQLQNQLNALRSKATKLDVIVNKGVFSSQQIAAASGRRVKWTSHDISRALGLRCRGQKAYEYVRGIFQFPLPSSSTLCRWTARFRITPGIMEAARVVLQAAVTGMDTLQRLCVISFDEMSLDGRLCYDPTNDQILSGSKLQLLMVRGLCDKWKQPLYYQFDTAMTRETLEEVIATLESLGLRVVATVSDMHPSNEYICRLPGVTESRTWITNPAHPDR